MYFNVLQIFAALNHAQIGYVVVGGLAVILAVHKYLDGMDVPVAGIGHLIEMKQRAGRTGDLDDIDKLQQIRDAERG